MGMAGWEWKEKQMTSKLYNEWDHRPIVITAKKSSALPKQFSCISEDGSLNSLKIV